MPSTSRRSLLQLLASGGAGLLAGCETGPAYGYETDPPSDSPGAASTASSTGTESPTATDTPTAGPGQPCDERWPATERWRHETGIRAYAPTVVDGVVYFGAQDDQVYALEAMTGAVRWEREQPIRLHGRPVAVQGFVVVPGYDAVAAFDAASGDPGWTFEPPGMHGQVEAGLVTDGDRLFLGASNRAGTEQQPAETPYERLYAVDVGVDEPAWFLDVADDGGTSGVAAADGTVFRAASDGLLGAHDAASGDVVWERSIVDDESAFEPRVGRDAVYVQTEGRLFAVERADGAVRWRDDRGYVGDPAVGDGRVYCVAGSELVALDAATGEHAWRAPLPAPNAANVDVAGDTVYVSVPQDDGSTLHALDAASGCRRGRFETAARSTTRVATTEDTVFVGGLHGDGAMHALLRP